MTMAGESSWKLRMKVADSQEVARNRHLIPTEAKFAKHAHKKLSQPLAAGSHRNSKCDKKGLEKRFKSADVFTPT